VFTQGDQVEFPRWMPVDQVVVPSRDSQGCCWARYQIGTCYRGEDYHLQIDSHTQFRPYWDRLVIADLNMVGPKSVITGHLPYYQFAERGTAPPRDAFRHDGCRFSPRLKPWGFRLHAREGLPCIDPMDIEEELDESVPPVETLYYSGHFAFSPGQFVVDVPYDPDLFFFGEEITMAVRAYCAGYNLYQPRKWLGSSLLARHSHLEDDAPARLLYWSPEEDSQREIGWWQRDIMSKIKAQAVVNGKWWGKYGIRNQDRYNELCQKALDWYQVDLASVIYQ
jgi:hypothetical protein